MVLVAVQVIGQASFAYNRFGLRFLTHAQWNPALHEFGAFTFLYGTLITSVVSVVLSAILGVSIGLFLAVLAPRRVSAVIGPMVELLAAIPSVVLGLIGIILLAPFLNRHVEPALHSALGFIPLFGTVPPVGNSLFTASLVLTIMVVPIISALSRDLFLTVPEELTDGAAALGATSWEVIRGVILPTTRSGIIAACVLGFGRAVGEAIAVSQIVGSRVSAPLNQFQPGDTLASRIANEAPSATLHIEVSSLYYLALILLVLTLVTNLLARQIAARSGRGGGVTVTTMADKILGWRGRPGHTPDEQLLETAQ
jgi:phosphate transport system permease protein